MNIISSTTILPSFKDTTMKSLFIGLEMLSEIDNPLNLDTKVCFVKHLTLYLIYNVSVWFSYFRCILSHWSKLKI